MTISYFDHFIDQNARWDWAYGSGTGYQNCPVSIETFGNTLLEIGISSDTSTSVYSDGNLHEATASHTGSDYLQVHCKSSDVTHGTFGWGFWNANSTNPHAVWFWYASTLSDAAYRGFMAMVMTGGLVTYSQLLSTIDYSTWHEYHVIRGSTYADFRIDNVSVASYSGAMSTHSMRAEMWVDNSYLVSGVRYYEAVTHYQRFYYDYAIYGSISSPDLTIFNNNYLQQGIM